MSDASATPPRPPGGGSEPSLAAGGWAPPTSDAYRTDRTESVRIITGGDEGGNGAEPPEPSVAPPADSGVAEADDTEEIGRGGEEKASGRRMLRAGLEWAVVIGGALLVAFLVKTFLVQAFWIPSPSMAETLVEGDRVLVNKLADNVGDINRGDIIVFKRPENGDAAHPEGQIQDLIKRVIGLQGDVIEARDGVVYVNDQRLDEPYVASGRPTNDMEKQTVPDGHVFVMGDNRTNSQDSRVFGPISGESIVGRAFVRVWPVSHLGRL